MKRLGRYMTKAPKGIGIRMRMKRKIIFFIILGSAIFFNTFGMQLQLLDSDKVVTGRTYQDFQSIIDDINKKSNTLEVADFSRTNLCAMNNETIARLSQSIASCCNLKKLNLNWTGIWISELVTILSHLDNARSLVELNLSGNYFKQDDQQIQNLFNVVEKNHFQIQKLNLCEASINANTLLWLLVIFSFNNENLQWLDLSGIYGIDNWSRSDALQITSELGKYRLVRLDLCDVNLNSPIIIDLLLQLPQTLLELDLGMVDRSRLREEDAKKLYEVWKDSSLQKVRILTLPTLDQSYKNYLEYVFQCINQYRKSIGKNPIELIC
jgi:hypothetical protein